MLAMVNFGPDATGHEETVTDAMVPEEIDEAQKPGGIRGSIEGDVELAMDL